MAALVVLDDALVAQLRSFYRADTDANTALSDDTCDDASLDSLTAQADVLLHDLEPVVDHVIRGETIDADTAEDLDDAEATFASEVKRLFEKSVRALDGDLQQHIELADEALYAGDTARAITLLRRGRAHAKNHRHTAAALNVATPARDFASRVQKFDHLLRELDDNSTTQNAPAA